MPERSESEREASGTQHELYDEAIRRIERAYTELGHTLGWRFLYSSKSTLSEHTWLMLVGANPGGSACEPPVPSCEAGNAYRRDVENWPSALQDEICSLFQAVASRLGGGTDWRHLLDATLTSNFCPFRSRGWSDLHRKPESVAFSRDLWTPLCRELRPRVIISIPTEATKGFLGVYRGLGYAIESDTPMPTGWGKTTIQSHTISKGPQSLVLFGIPHPSQYRFLRNPTFSMAAAWLADGIASTLPK